MVSQGNSKAVPEQNTAHRVVQAAKYQVPRIATHCTSPPCRFVPAEGSLYSLKRTSDCVQSRSIKDLSGNRTNTSLWSGT
jgi:hypothetical protein